MGQKQYRNFYFPQHCISNNNIVFSKQQLLPSSKQNLVHLTNSTFNIIPPMKTFTQIPKLTFLTYNVWFEQNNAENRIPCLLKLMSTSNADFICLQQVTASFLNVFLKEKWVKEKYFLSGFQMRGYQSIILTKFHCNIFKYKFQESSMNRSLILAETLINGKPFAIATSHFQSLNSAHIRKIQLKITFDLLNKYQNAILMGDFNFDSKWKQEESNIDTKFIDLWIQLKKNTQYTMPQTYRYPSWRPDRILLKSENWIAENIQKLGNFTIPPYQNDEYVKIKQDGIVRTPSDHFGLICQIKAKQKQQKSIKA